ncbi:MAG: thermonuclease family protein [Candidatus Hadarchaeales archaeon]
MAVAAGAVCAAVTVALCLWPTVSKDFPENRERLEIVERVIDGDTIVITGGERIRLAGVDAPPLYARDGSGRRAKEFLENLCPPGSPISVDPDDLAGRDRYGRLLAVIYAQSSSGPVNVNAEVLKSGNATILLIPPTEFNPYVWMADNEHDC